MMEIIFNKTVHIIFRISLKQKHTHTKNANWINYELFRQQSEYHENTEYLSRQYTNLQQSNRELFGMNLWHNHAYALKIEWNTHLV